MSLNKRDSEVGGMLSVPRSKTPASIINITNVTEAAKEDKKDDGGGDTTTTGPVVETGGPKVPDTKITDDPKTGVWTGGELPKITSDDSWDTAINKYTAGVGAFASQPAKNDSFGAVDTKAASELAGLAKGKGAGDTKKEQKQNESQIANILSLGLPNVINKGKDDKNKSGKDGSKDKDKDKGKDDNKNKSATSGILGNVTTAGGAVHPDESGGVQDKKDKDKGKDKDKDKGKKK